MDLRLELVLLPVDDVDRSKSFYTEKAGFNLDVDTEPSPGFRIVQMTPPGSDCSITIGSALDLAAPGSVRGLHLVVTDIEAARQGLVDRGVEMDEITHFSSEGQVKGPHPDRADFGSYSGFSDPDGNTWVLQERGYRK